jgi:transcriptional regulator with XRE-family HTH domain
MTLGEYLKKKRFDKRLKAREVCAKLGIHESELSFYENDKREPRLRVLFAILCIYDCSPNDLMEIYVS